jgi:cyclopropane fatty-acyl-phospholipid synthase-like methyltransferase
MAQLIMTGSVRVPNTIGENLKQWSNWDWSARGEEWTPGHDWKFSLATNVLQPNIPVGSRVLEIGPGGGRWTEFLIERAGHLTVVDLTPECINICRQRFRQYQNISYIVNDGRDLSIIPPGSVDRIWSFDVFVHIRSQDIENYVRQFSTILAEGGRGVIHHCSKGEQKKGWRSDMTAQKMLDMCAQNGLRVLHQFTSWDENRFHISPDSPDSSIDVITVFEKPH